MLNYKIFLTNLLNHVGLTIRIENKKRFTTKYIKNKGHSAKPEDGAQIYQQHNAEK